MISRFLSFSNLEYDVELASVETAEAFTKNLSMASKLKNVILENLARPDRVFLA